MEKKTKAVQLKEFQEAVLNWYDHLYQNGRNFEGFMQKIPALQAITQQYESCWKGDKRLELLVKKIENSQKELNEHVISMYDVENMAWNLQKLLEELIDAPRITMLNRVTKKVTEDPELLKEADKFINKYYSKK